MSEGNTASVVFFPDLLFTAAIWQETVWLTQAFPIKLIKDQRKDSVTITKLNPN